MYRAEGRSPDEKGKNVKKILLTGLSPDVTEEKLSESISHFGEVVDVQIVRDGDPNAPIAIIQMNINDEQAYSITTRITDIWHAGQRVNARLILH